MAVCCLLSTPISRDSSNIYNDQKPKCKSTQEKKWQDYVTYYAVTSTKLPLCSVNLKKKRKKKQAEDNSFYEAAPLVRL